MSTQNQPDSTKRVAPTLANADRLRRSGNKAEAERVCRQILAANPNAPDALNLLFTGGNTGKVIVKL